MSDEAAAADPNYAIAAVLGRMLHSCRFPLDNEKATQAFISQTLKGLGIDHVREHRLIHGDRVDIVDFWLPSEFETGAIIEVKMNRGVRPAEVLKQLGRYAEHTCVRAMFLVSNKAMSIPAQIGGKPAICFSLGRAWL